MVTSVGKDGGGAVKRWGIKRFEQLSIKQTTKIYHATWGSYFL